ncbi:MAG TPA: murein biosynthesis integral membrane protein MurJ [Spirochaetes bacterium]|nr:murein biosynthesis integral membrane protein MurJ [Spirochaetota bacterium]
MNKKVFLRTTLIITFATLLSKVLGLVRQQYSIFLFGGGWEFDAFIAAFRIPNALRELLAEGALSAAFIPIFSAILVREGKKEAFLFANKVLNITILITIAVTLTGALIADGFMSSYHNPSPLASSLASQLFYIMMFYLPFISLSALIMGMLNSMNQFTIPALGPFFSNITFLLVLYFSYRLFNGLETMNQIQALAYAVVAGGCTYLLIQIPALIKSGFRFHFSIDFKDKHIREFFTLFVPFAVAMGIPKLNNILSNLYSYNIEGGNTALSQGFFIIQLPLSIFVAGISMVSLPNMSKYFENKDMDGLKDLVLMGLRLVFFFTVPSVVGLMVLDFEIPRFIYKDVLLIFSGGEAGKITNTVIENISKAQFYFAPAILSMGLSIVFIRAFQSMKDMKTMIYTGIASVALHLGLMSLLVGRWGWSFEGIALSITVSSYFNLILLIAILIRQIGRFSWTPTLVSMVKIVAASIVMGGVILILNQWATPLGIISTPYLDNILSTTLLIAFGVMTYLVALYLLKEKEFREIVKRIGRKLLSRKK